MSARTVERDGGDWFCESCAEEFAAQGTPVNPNVGEHVMRDDAVYIVDKGDV